MVNVRSDSLEEAVKREMKRQTNCVSAPYRWAQTVQSVDPKSAGGDLGSGQTIKLQCP